MNGSNFERSITTDPFLETGADAVEFDEQTAYDRELDIIIAHYDEESPEPTAEMPELEPALKPETEQNPQMTWPESNPDGTIDEAAFSRRLDWRLTGLGFVLDAIADKLTTDEEAEQWVELKQVVLAAKNVSDPYRKMDYVMEAEKAVNEFTVSRGATYEDYLGGRE